MNRFILLFGFSLVALAGCQTAEVDPAASVSSDYSATPSNLDAFWAESARTVADGDFEGYSATYHKDAVLVSGLSGTSYPIASALAGWKDGFDKTVAGKQKSSVVFRFSQRLSDETTAHDTGIFNYTAEDSTGAVTSNLVHFEGLLVMENGWKMVMEYQKSRATQEDWDALQ
jgi:hypothetical protein